MNAGLGRFRAIFLTTVTTVAGLMPLMNETSEQAQYLIPAAVLWLMVKYLPQQSP